MRWDRRLVLRAASGPIVLPLFSGSFHRRSRLAAYPPRHPWPPVHLIEHPDEREAEQQIVVGARVVHAPGEQLARPGTHLVGARLHLPPEEIVTGGCHELERYSTPCWKKNAPSQKNTLPRSTK